MSKQLHKNFTDEQVKLLMKLLAAELLGIEPQAIKIFYLPSNLHLCINFLAIQNSRIDNDSRINFNNY